MNAIFNFPKVLVNAGLEPDNFTNREKVEILEYLMLNFCIDNKNSFKLTHHFRNDIYVRKIVFPKDTITIGKVHKTTHWSLIKYGDVSVMTDKLERITGPCKFISPAGIKRAVVAHEDTLWMTFHKVDTDDLDAIEQAVVYDSDLTWCEGLRLESSR